MNQTKRLMEKLKRKPLSSPESMKAVRWTGWVGLWWEGFLENKKSTEFAKCCQMNVTYIKKTATRKSGMVQNDCLPKKLATHNCEVSAAKDYRHRLIDRQLGST